MTTAPSRVRRVAVTAAVWACRVGVIAAVAWWMQIAPGRWVSKFAVAKPSSIAAEFGRQFGSSFFYHAVLTTVFHSVVALIVASIAGILSAWLLWSSVVARRLISPYLIVAYSTPRIVFLPLFIFWFGFGSTTVLVYAIIACFFIFIFNGLEGFDAVGRRLVGVMSVIGLNRRQMLGHCLLPAARGYILAAALVAFPTAVLAAIMGEMILGGGLGGWILLERGKFSITGLYTATIAATAVGAILNTLAQWAGVTLRKRMGDEAAR